MHSNKSHTGIPVMLAIMLVNACLFVHSSDAQVYMGHGSYQHDGCRDLDDEDCCNGEPIQSGYKCCGGVQIPEDYECCDGNPAPPGATCCETDEDCPDCHECKDFYCQEIPPAECCEGKRLAAGMQCCNGTPIAKDAICCHDTPHLCCGNIPRDYPGQECCGDKPLTDGMLCCRDTEYDPAIEGCCGGKLPYNLTTDICCDDGEAYLNVNARCCGADVIGKDEVCCLTEPELCCGDEPIPPGWICCDGNLAPPGSICCETDQDCSECESCISFYCQKTKSEGEPDCCDPCEAARNNIAADVAGGVVCCNGEKYSCAWYHDVNNSKAAELIFYCIKKHEDEHHDSLTCPENGFHVFEFFDDGVDVNAEEIHAHNVEFDCLIDSLPHCEGDPQCVADLLKTMGHVNDQIQDYGGSPRPLP